MLKIVKTIGYNQEEKDLIENLSISKDIKSKPIDTYYEKERAVDKAQNMSEVKSKNIDQIQS